MSTGTTWTAFRDGFRGCDTTCSFLCLEVGRDVAVALPAPSTSGRILFATHAFWTGGSLASADAVCATEATTAGVPGTFRALLATTSQPPAARVASLTGPWRRGDGVLLTTGTLGAGPLEISPNIGADGVRVAITPSLSRAWTGAPDLTTAGDVVTTCNDWSSSSGYGTTGRLAISTARRTDYGPGVT